MTEKTFENIRITLRQSRRCKLVNLFDRFRVVELRNFRIAASCDGQAGGKEEPARKASARFHNKNPNRISGFAPNPRLVVQNRRTHKEVRLSVGVWVSLLISHSDKIKTQTVVGFRKLKLHTESRIEWSADEVDGQFWYTMADRKSLISNFFFAVHSCSEKLAIWKLWFLLIRTDFYRKAKRRPFGLF